MPSAPVDEFFDKGITDDVVEFLIHEGHDLKTMLGMTVKQLMLFSKLAADRNLLDVATQASATRIAYHADKNQYAKFLDELKEDG